jgi:hypothetical protein
VNAETWYPENWPGGRAPASWEVRHGSIPGTFEVHAELWVFAEWEEVHADLWWRSSMPMSAPAATPEERANRLAVATRRAIMMARELEAARDEALLLRVGGGAYGAVVA